MKPKLLILIVLCCLGGGVVKYCQLKQELAEQKDHIPTVFELQQQLKDKGYEIKVDGIVGQETINVWDRALCDQYAKMSWDRYAEMAKK